MKGGFIHALERSPKTSEVVGLKPAKLEEDGPGFLLGHEVGAGVIGGVGANIDGHPPGQGILNEVGGLSTGA